MRRMRELIGLPVLETSTGKVLGQVQDAAVNIDKAIICGFFIANAAMSGQNNGVLFHDIFAVGQDAVTVTSAVVIRSMDEDSLKQGNFIRLSFICDKKVYTEMGDFLGIVSDISYDASTGEILSYEISDSFVTDFLYGRLIMPLPRAQVVDMKKIIVPEEMAKLMYLAN